MYFAIGVEPTNDTAPIPGWLRIASTASLSPCTTFSTPSGSPASLKSSAIRSEAEGTFSEGLRMNALPQAIATGNIQSGTITGKLNGVMPAHTPTGWRTLWLSTPVPTFSECSPFRRCGTPQANSTTSIPRCTEPIASGNVLPCSSVTIRASAFWFSCRSWRNRCITRARRKAGASRQAGNAAWAAFTAASMSALLQNGTRFVTAPSAGLVTSPKRPLVEATWRPPIQSGTVTGTSTGLFILALLDLARPRSVGRDTPPQPYLGGRHRRRAVAPRLADIGDDRRDLLIAQVLGERRHAERAWIALGARRKATDEHHPDRVDRMRHQDRAVVGERRIDPRHALAVRLVAVRAMLLVNRRARLEHRRSLLLRGPHLQRLGGSALLRLRLEVDGHGAQVADGDVLQAVGYHRRHRPEHRAARRHAGAQEVDDVLHLPVAEPGLPVGRERWRVPVLHRDQAASDVVVLDRAEHVAVAVAGVAVAEPFDQVRAAVPFRALRGVGLVLAGREVQRAPAD